jgi:hypothetical protein
MNDDGFMRRGSGTARVRAALPSRAITTTAGMLREVILEVAADAAPRRSR